MEKGDAVMNRFLNTENYLRELIDGDAIEFDSFEMNPVWEEAELTRNGDAATFRFADGEWYEGEEKEGIPRGLGTYTFKKGNLYKGMWKDGLPHGQGKFYYHDGSLAYEGELKQGQYDGFGSAYYPDGSYYVGEWSEGAISGLGYCIKRFGRANEDTEDPYIYDWIPFSWYVGEWKDNVPDGKGRIFMMEPDVSKTTDADHFQRECWQAVQTRRRLAELPDMTKNRKYLWYEGEMKDGDPYGVGSFYDEEGHLRFHGEVKGSIEKLNMLYDHVPQWSDDIRTPELDADPWIYFDGKPVIKLGYGEFYTKNGEVWFKGSMDHIR